MCDGSYPPITEKNCGRCGKRFGYKDESDQGAIPPEICPECQRAEAIPVPVPFLEAFKNKNFEV